MLKHALFCVEIGFSSGACGVKPVESKILLAEGRSTNGAFSKALFAYLRQNYFAQPLLSKPLLSKPKATFHG